MVCDVAGSTVQTKCTLGRLSKDMATALWPHLELRRAPESDHKKSAHGRSFDVLAIILASVLVCRTEQGGAGTRV